jgi:hypothetical protein
MQQTLAKPQPNTAGQYEYSELIQYLERQYGFVSEDSTESHSHFDKWADAKGYTKRKKDPDGSLRGSSQVWYAEYQDDPTGAACRPTSKSFRLWLYWLGNAFLGRDAPKTPLTLNMGLLLGNWNEEVAPVLQRAVDLCRLRITNCVEGVMEAEGLPPEYRARVLRDALSEAPVDALIPDFALRILEHIRQEFGECPVVVFRT